MRLDEKYTLIELLEDGSVKTCLARETATGRMVNVFLFTGEQTRVQADLIRQMNSEGRKLLPELIETGIDEYPYMVTQPLGSFGALKSRLSQPASRKENQFSTAGVWQVPQVQPQNAARLPDATKSVSQPAGTGEYTGLFGSAAPPVGEPELKITLEEPHPSHAPGEFTRLFRSPTTPFGESALSPATPAAVHELEPVTASHEPASGEFTRLFQSPASSSEEPAVAAPAPTAAPATADATPGDFTRLFQSPAAPIGEPTLQPPGPAASQEPASSPASGAPMPGEFTRLFQTPGSSSEQTATNPPAASTSTPIAVPPAADVAPGEFTRLFQFPAAPIGEPTLQLPGPAASQGLGSPPASGGSVPGGFTGFFQSPTSSQEELPYESAGAFAAPAPALPQTEQPPSSNKLAPGEFTSLFQAASPSSGPASAVINPSGQGEFTRIFKAGATNAGTGRAGVQSTQIFGAPESSESYGLNPPPSPQDTCGSSAGEFTRIFGGAPVQTSPSISSPQASDTPGDYTRAFGIPSVQPNQETRPEPENTPPEVPAPEKATSKLVPWLFGVIVLLLVIILFLLLRK
jgi:hypothetical protein